MGRITMPRAVALGGAILAIIAFLLPWVQYANASYSGLGLATAIGPAIAAVKAGGLKGFDIALYLIPVLAIVSIAFTLLSSRAATAEAESRLASPRPAEYEALAAKVKADLLTRSQWLGRVSRRRSSSAP